MSASATKGSAGCLDASLKALQRADGPLTMRQIMIRSGYAEVSTREALKRLRTQGQAHVVSEALPYRWLPGPAPAADGQLAVAAALVACLRVMHASAGPALDAEATSVLSADWDRAIWDGMRALRRAGIEPPAELANWSPPRLAASLAMTVEASP